jgi:hypothetical protein
MKPALLALALVLPTIGRADGNSSADASDGLAAASNGQPVVLEPMTIYGDTKLSFGFGLRVMRIENPRIVLEITVDRVKTGSDAERKGLKPGSRVVSINGRDVSGYEATFVNGSELNRLFVDRPEGASVTMEVLVPGKKKIQKLTIVRRSLLYEPPRIGGLPN